MTTKRPFQRNALAAALMTFCGAVTFSAHAITIEQAWQAAKAFDPTYSQAQIQSQISETEVRSTKSALLPSFSLSADTSWDDDGNNTKGYGATLSQTIWDSANWAQLDQSQASYVASQLKVKTAHNELAATLLYAYLDLASAQGDRQLAEQKFVEGAKLLKITEQRYKAGKIQSTALEDMRANHVDEQADILSAQAALEEKKSALIALINRDPQHIDQIKTTDLIEPPMQVSSETEWLKLAQDNSPELLAAQQEVAASEFGRDAAKAKYYPTLSGSVSYQDNDQGRDGDLSAGLSLKIPLDLNGSTRATVDQAALQVLSAKQVLRKVDIEIKRKIQSGFNQIHLDWRQVEMAQLQVRSREQALKSKQTVYESGMTEASDLIDAHNALFNSKNSLQRRLYQYWKQRIGLLQAAGQLDDDVIASLSQALHS
ncbi:TolC family protein [Vibrio anguillarum]|uniref:TolC family protein n=1 Tax=Vibrio anguillarum TaxID=55601 RepID=A0A289GFB0_VIBAN|nr:MULTISPECIES: TolC family protein [Vibrio]ASW82687.1 TolC family protein [Vibrio anguillarum]AXN05817.1 TolC family protein [Vibrio anguillarum]AZS26873.1 TolC family protein [Vibrio anguillarum]MBF4311055.1 TolC family protein [Vibrio anguillarum]MBF4325937.1 TolC family protein [Vibrio anguillarum]